MTALLCCFVFCSIFLGNDVETGKRLYIPLHSFLTHWHLIAATGKGKTTTIEAILHQLFLLRQFATHFIFDRMGSFSHSLLMFLSSPYCPQWVRDRVLYIDASREDLILPFNPLLYDTLAHGYYKVTRACDIILRAWASQNIEEMPRLARWLFNAMWAAAQLGLTVADCAHLLMPGSPYHGAILNLLPDMLRAEWAEIQNARGGEAGRILESSRNRIKLFHEFPILRSIFGCARNFLDIPRLMREGRIVIIDLSPKNRLTPQAADAIGGMILNEIFAVLRSLPWNLRFAVYMWLDEFQRFVSPDLEEAIPEIRQLGGRMVFSHQAFSQLIKGDTDLSGLIWQPQSRMIFGVQGEDADLLAHEVASLKYDPKMIKDEMYTRRQLLKGHEVIQLRSWSESESAAENWQKTVGTHWSASKGTNHSNGTAHSDSRGISRRMNDPLQNSTLSTSKADSRSASDATTSSNGIGGNENTGEGGSRSHSTSNSIGESLLPIHEEFKELSRRSYYTFEEQRALWAQQIRLLKTGQALVKIVNDPNLYRVDVQKHAPGYLGLDMDTITRRCPAALDAKEQLIEQNYAQEFFVSPTVIEREREDRLQRLLHPVINIPVEPGANRIIGQARIEENPLA